MLDVLVDQSGYGPGDRKGFVVQCNEPIAGQGRFYLESVSGGVVFSGVLGSRFDRVDWDAYYWSGDFTPFQRRGNFTIRVELGEWTARSPRFEMDNEVLLEECGELIYEWLRYMRCGVAHEYRAKPCHLDDGVLPNGTHIDATGGWHCAGIWGGKYSEYDTYVLFNLLLAYDIRPDFFGSIDRIGMVWRTFWTRPCGGASSCSGCRCRTDRSLMRWRRWSRRTGSSAPRTTGRYWTGCRPTTASSPWRASPEPQR
ncbi:hypothetical protein FDZ71_07700, partial [bacterium]